MHTIVPALPTMTTVNTFHNHFTDGKSESTGRSELSEMSQLLCSGADSDACSRRPEPSFLPHCRAHFQSVIIKAVQARLNIVRFLFLFDLGPNECFILWKFRSEPSKAPLPTSSVLHGPGSLSLSFPHRLSVPSYTFTPHTLRASLLVLHITAVSPSLPSKLTNNSWTVLGLFSCSFPQIYSHFPHPTWAASPRQRRKSFCA